MCYQMYLLHLLNGSVIEVSEDYDLPMEKGLIGRYKNAESNEILEFGDPIVGFAYVPKSSIVYISIGDVKEG